LLFSKGSLLLTSSLSQVRQLLASDFFKALQLSSSRNFNKRLNQKRLNHCWSTKTLLLSKGSLLLTSSLNKI